MPVTKSLKLDFDWREILSEESDWKQLGALEAARQLHLLHVIRAFEEAVVALHKQGLVHGPVHTSIGQEAVAVGVAVALRRSDKIFSTHRAHHHFLSKALRFHMSDDFDPRTRPFPPPMQHVVTRTLAEVMGLRTGFCRGWGGSMHLRDVESGILGTNAIVGGGIPMAAGAAWAGRFLGKDDVVVCFLGDGAVNQGSFHEALNLAALWKAPIIYCIENNFYAVGTHVREACSVEPLSVRAAAYGIPARLVDGMDPLALKTVIEESASAIRSGAGPVLVEAVTYRHVHHAGDAPGSSFGYRDAQEEAAWRKRDPLQTVADRSHELGLLTESEIEELRHSARAVVEHAVEECTERKEGKRSIPQSLWPDRTSLLLDVQPNDQRLAGVRYSELEDFDELEQMRYVEAIAAVTGAHLEKDNRVFVLGEEVANLGGGPYQATKGLAKRFPGRVRNTPISEAGFSGLALGAALAGLRPIVEIMFPDFALVGADQIFNQIGKVHYMYGGDVDVPLVMRTRVAIGCGYGPQHSMDPVAIFSLFPGWRIVAPSTPFDYIGLVNSAMELAEPVLVVEHWSLYSTTGPAPKGNLDYFVPLGKARVARPGDDVTVIAYSSMVGKAAQASEQLREEGVSAEVIDLRTLDTAHIDYATIGESLQKTGVALVVEEAPRSNSIGAKIAHGIDTRFFSALDAPVGHLAAADVGNPVSRVLESEALPSVEKVKEAIRTLANRQV